MKIGNASRLAAFVACLGMVAPPAAFAGSPAVAADVALRDGGVFVGRVVTAQGAPVAATKVSLRSGAAEVAATTTDADGVFAAQGLRSGAYQVVADGGVVSYRLWTPETAPPAANTSALIVTNDGVVSGQYGGSPGILAWVREHPLLVAAGVATAIAVPLAVADDDDDAPATP